MHRHAGKLLIAIGVGHAIVGLVLFRQPLAAIVGDGVLNTVRDQLDRQAAFWFLLMSPLCVALGQVVDRAIERGDQGTLGIVGWNLLAIGVVGAAMMPLSGFWFVIAVAPLVLRAERRSNAVAA